MEWDYAMLVFDGFQEFLENLHEQSKEEREKGDQLINVLMEWTNRNSKSTHIVFIGDNPFGEEALRQRKLALLLLFIHSLY
jgi:hypothetical protein